MDDSQISILVCPDQNMTDSDLRHLLLQLEIQFFALTYYQGFAAIEFATTSALIAASQHPSLTGFKLLKVLEGYKPPGKHLSSRDQRLILDYRPYGSLFKFVYIQNLNSTIRHADIR